MEDKNMNLKRAGSAGLGVYRVWWIEKRAVWERSFALKDDGAEGSGEKAGQ
jgi:hypothetical protein